jgi:hypothetical protein
VVVDAARGAGAGFAAGFPATDLEAVRRAVERDDVAGFFEFELSVCA